MEILFSKEQITEIIYEADSNLNYYLGTAVFYGESTETRILTISKNKQLIFVEGNNHTGFKHLRERHVPFNFKNYWVLDTENGARLDKPSKFHPKMMPIVEYVKIADAVFSDENKNEHKNKRSDLFDMFTGIYCFESDIPETFHLIMYKDTRLVHSLFPDKKKHNRKNKTSYGKGFVLTKTKFSEAHNDLIVPYENERGKIEYSVLIRKFYKEKIERTFILKHDTDENPESSYQIAEQTFTDFESFNREDINRYQLTDLEYFEKIIDRIDNEGEK